MSDTTRTQLDLELTRLGKRVDELVAMVEHLREENRALRARHESLAGERAALMHKNEQVTHQDQARVSVRIMDKEYVVACPYDERSALLDAAEFLNARMREIRDTGKVVGLDRIAVMAALNLAHEYLKGKDRESKLDNGVGQRVRALRERVEGTLGKSQQLEL